MKKCPITQFFFAKDLVSGAEWNKLKKGDKLSFGRSFKKAVQENEMKNVRFIGKADNNSAQYKKTEEKNETINL